MDRVPQSGRSQSFETMSVAGATGSGIYEADIVPTTLDFPGGLEKAAVPVDRARMESETGSFRSGVTELPLHPPAPSRLGDVDLL